MAGLITNLIAGGMAKTSINESLNFRQMSIGLLG
jgi:hypothetical protein